MQKCIVYISFSVVVAGSETFVAGTQARAHPHAHCYFPIITLHIQHTDSNSEVGF